MMEAKETACHKRDREYLERVIDERDKLYADRFRALEKLIDERDRLYESRFKALETNSDSRFRAQEIAVNAALAAQEKSVSAAFAASEKAIVKAEQAQKEYNERSNEFRGQLDDQAKTLMPRPETLSMFKGLDDKLIGSVAQLEAKIEGTNSQIDSLRQSRSEGGGRDIARRESGEKNQWSAGLIIAVLLALISMITSIYLGTRTATVPVIYNTPTNAGATK